MKTEKQYEEQIINSLKKVPFEMKKIKFIIFLAKYFNRLKREKTAILKVSFFVYTIIITYLYFTK